MRRAKRRALEAKIESMSPEEHQEWLLLQMAGDLKEIRNIVVAWWWLVWIGVAIVVVSAIISSS